MLRSKQMKMMSAGVGAGAIVGMAILGTGGPQLGTGTANSAPAATLGETATATTPPGEPVTSRATPPFTFTTPSGFAAPH